AAARRARNAGRRGDARVRGFFVRRAFLGDSDFDRSAVGIAEPEPVRLGAGRRGDARNAKRVEPLAKTCEIILARAEGDELQLLARPLDHRAPAMRMTVRVNIERAALLAHVEAEACIEFACRFEIRHREIEPVKRVHAELAWAALYRLREVAN